MNHMHIAHICVSYVCMCPRPNRLRYSLHSADHLLVTLQAVASAVYLSAHMCKAVVRTSAHGREVVAAPYNKYIKANEQGER